MLRIMNSKTVIISLILMKSLNCICQSFKFKLFSPLIKVEKDVPSYVLPNILECYDGTIAETKSEWEKRRMELLDLFSTYMYGEVPIKQNKIGWEVLCVEENAYGGRAIRKDIRIIPIKLYPEYNITVQIYLPPKSKEHPVPIFLALGFHKNYTVCDDESIDMYKLLGPNGDKNELKNRGSKSNFWNLDLLLERGYGLATFWHQELVPDTQEDFINSFPSRFYSRGQHFPLPNEWGMISLWAWQLSRVMDYIVKDKNIDKKKVIAIGHSRLGKAALWAAAQDERFAMAVSNNSGCGGAALSRRRFGENIEAINQRFPQWFCGNYKQFANRESFMPFDQHELIGMMAPRPVYIASSEEDWWSDPLGEFLGGKEANPAYHIYGLPGLECESIPPVGKSVDTGYIGYHIRRGKHDMTRYDVEQYLNFADKHLKIKP